MFSLFNRGQHVFNLSSTVLAFAALAIIVSSWCQLYTQDALNAPSVFKSITPTASMKFSRRYGSPSGKPKENSKIVFDLDADLTSLFNWNTKQVFVYLTAEYPGKSENSSNKITYWDKIITSKDKANLSLTNERAAYSVWDVEQSFRNREAVVKLEWNIQPHVGPLIYGETTGDAVFNFASAPQEAKDDKKKQKV